MKKFLLFLLLVWSIFSYSFAEDFSSIWNVNDYLKTQKDAVVSSIDSTYTKLFDQFQSTNLSVIKSLNYKSLVCLWVMKDSPIISDMQTEIQKIKSSFLISFSQLESDAYSLEQKNTLQTQTQISLFQSWTTYESEKVKLLVSLANLIATTKNSLQSLQQNYSNKMTDFTISVSDYTSKNTALISSVQSKIIKITTLDQKISNLSNDLMNINKLLVWSWGTFFDNLEKIKSSAISNLDLKLTNVINPWVRRYSFVKTLSWDLSIQKDYALRLYGLDFDEKLNNLLLKWYSNSDFKLIKQQYDALKQSYFLGSNLNCQKAMVTSDFDTQIDGLLSKISTMQTSVQSWIMSAQWYATQWAYKKEIISWFTDFTTTGLNKRINEFQTLINIKAPALYDTYQKSLTLSSLQSNTWTIVPIIWVSTLSIPQDFSFKRPFKNWEKNNDVKILQTLLSSYGLYTGQIDWKYSPLTVQAVYQFQLKNWLLVGYEKRPQTWWWMWPSTRKALNGLLIK